MITKYLQRRLIQIIMQNSKDKNFRIKLQDQEPSAAQNVNQAIGREPIDKQPNVFNINADRNLSRDVTPARSTAMHGRITNMKQLDDQSIERSQIGPGEQQSTLGAFGPVSPINDGTNALGSIEMAEADQSTDKFLPMQSTLAQADQERNRFQRGNSNVSRDGSPGAGEDSPVESLREEDKSKIQFVLNMFRKEETVDVLGHTKPQTQQELFMQQPYISNGAFFFHKDIKDRSKRLVIYDKTSCGCFSAESPFRKWLVWLICSPYFDNFIIFIITLNSLQLAVMDYSDRDNETQRNRVLDRFGTVFTVIFIVEAILKITAMSFFWHRNSYLRDGWNILDFVVVLVGIVELMPFLPQTNLRALRTLRVLRPLRSINAFPSMKKLVSSLLEALPQLGSAVFFMFIIFLIFSILGTQQFKGVFYQRCRVDSQPFEQDGNWTWPQDVDSDRTCTLDGAGDFSCPEGTTCGDPYFFKSMRVTKESDGVYDDSGSNFGIAVFDNMLLGFVTVFQMVTLEGWSDIMYTLMDASQPAVAIIFCCLVVIVGSFFLLNVVLAVIMEAFEDVDKNAEIQEARKRKEYKWLLQYYEQEDNEVSDSEQENEQCDQNPPAISVGQIDKSVVGSLKVGEIEEAKADLPDLAVQMPKLPKAQNHNPNAIVALGNTNQLVEGAVKEEEFIYGDGSTPSRARKNILYYICYCTQGSNMFSGTMVLAIILNTLILSLDRYPISKSEEGVLEIVNEVMTYTFLVEMIIMITGLGPNEYARDSFNLFDAFVVVLSIVELIIKKAGVAFTNGAFSALRAVRLLRVFKLARKWTSFRELLGKMSDTLGEIQYFAVLVLLFMFIETLLGMELFAYNVKYNNADKEEVVLKTEPGEYPRPNFNTFLDGFMMIFIVFIGENWNEAMYDHTRVLGYGCIIYFMQLFILGNIVLLNLFLAILLQNFEEPPGKSEEEQALDRESATQETKQLVYAQAMREHMCCCIPTSVLDSEAPNIKAVEPAKPDQWQDTPNVIEVPKRKNRDLKSQQTSSAILLNPSELAKPSEVQSDPSQQPSGALRSLEPVPPDLVGEGLVSSPTSKNGASQSPDKKSQFGQKSPMSKSQEKKKKSNFSLGSIKQLEELKSKLNSKKPTKLTGYVFGCLSPENPLRMCCARIVGHPHFETFIIILILVSTILLIFENPLSDPKGTKAKVLYVFDIIMTALFSIEMVLKVMVAGFICNGNKSYLQDSWCQLDFLIVVISILNLTMASAADLAFLKILRLVRVLRPLRMVSRNPGLRIAVMSILYALPPIKNVLVVSLLFVLLFAILFTTFFKGLFYTCDASHIPQVVQDNILNKFDCMDYGGDWVNKDQNFDNVQSSILTLFNVMTTEGWIGVMYDGIDSTKIDMMPAADTNKSFFFFFMFYMFVGSLFVLNMFVGVTINVFNKEKEQLQLDHLLTPVQIEWCDVLINIYKMKPLKKYVTTGNQFRDVCNMVASSKTLDHTIFLCILLNTLVLSLSWYGQNEKIINVCEILNLIFNVIYTFEAAIKLFALGWEYFSDGWNNFDFLIVLAGWIGTITNNIEGLNIGAFMTVLRAFRIGRIFKIVKKYRDLKVLFYTFIGAIPQLTYVGGLLFLLLFIYAILGVQLFATVQLQDAMNVHANFKSFGRALLTLFRMSTGESWHELMYDAMRRQTYAFDCFDQTYEEMITNGDGDDPVPMGCGRPIEAVIYFVSFMVIMSFVFLNLFIAIILENFNIQNDAANLKVTQDTLEAFNLNWLRFDPKGRGFINVMQITQLIDIMLEDEVTQVIAYNKQVEQGQIDDEEIRTVFLFNLHKDKDLETIFAHKMDTRMQAEFHKMQEESKKNGEPSEDLKEGGQRPEDDSFDLPDLEYSDEELQSTFMPVEERNKRTKWRRLRRLYNRFTAKLRIPCYKDLSYFYYYDVLEGVSRVLFQYDLEKTQEFEDCERSQDAASRSYSDLDYSEDQFKSDNEDSEGDEAENIDHRRAIEKVALEHKRDIRTGELEYILEKLEQKGARNNILKYKQMSELRARVNQNVQKMLDLHGAGHKQEVLDSSHVIGGVCIKKFLKRRREAKAREQAEATKVEANNNIEPIQEAAGAESEGTSSRQGNATNVISMPESNAGQRSSLLNSGIENVARVVSSSQSSKKSYLKNELPGNNQDGARPVLSMEESKQQAIVSLTSEDGESQAQLIPQQLHEGRETFNGTVAVQGTGSPDSQAAIQAQGRNVKSSTDTSNLGAKSPIGPSN